MRTQKNRQIQFAIGKISYKATNPIAKDYWVVFGMMLLVVLVLAACLCFPKLVSASLPILKKLVGF